MAKLRDQMTSQELLELILDGTIKNDIIKKYRTSDEELAMMLLPLYRNGDLTKEEFNDFFKGITLAPRKPASEEPARPPSHEDQAPSEIVRSLATGPQEEAAAIASQPDFDALGDSLEMDLTPRSEEAEILEPVAPEVTPDQSLSVNGQAPEQETPVQAPTTTEGGPSLSDSAAVSSVLDMIFAKLGSIDSRLDAIEKKLTSR